MTGKAPRTKEAAPTGATNGNRPASITDQVIQTIKDVTGATEEEIDYMLIQCNFNPDETTSRLLESAGLYGGSD